MITLNEITQKEKHLMAQVLADTTSRFQAEHGIGLPVTESYLDEWLEYAAESTAEGEEYWYVLRNEDGVDVGYASIYWIEMQHRHADCMIHVLQEYRRRGYGMETAQLLLDKIFVELGLHKACCELMEGREEYASFVQRLGFVQDGYRSDMYFSGGRYWGTYYFSMLEEEYQKQREEIPKNAGQGTLSRDFSNPLGKQRLCGRVPEITGGYYWKSRRLVITGMTEAYVDANREILDSKQDQYLYISREMEQDDVVFEEQEALVDFNEENDSMAYAILDMDGNYVGNIHLVGMDDKQGRFSYNIYIRRKFRGKGYGTEALLMILRYAFLELRMHKMICNANQGNEASAAMMRSAGCHVEGTRRQEVFYDGCYHDMVMFGMTKEAFCMKNKNWLPECEKA